MTMRLIALGAMFVAAPALAAEPEPKATIVKQIESREMIDSLGGQSTEGSSVEGATPETQAILASCSAMKFETSVIVGTGANARVTKVKMCSRAGDTKEQWIASLTDAAKKIDGNLELAPDSRVKLVAAIQAEIARLKS